MPETLGGVWGKINIYADKTGDEVVAWWYQDCGYPEGIVEVGAGRPTTCSATDTTGVSDEAGGSNGTLVADGA